MPTGPTGSIKHFLKRRKGRKEEGGREEENPTNWLHPVYGWM